MPGRSSTTRAYVVGLVTVAILVSGCAPAAGSPTAASGSQGTQASGGVKRIVAATTQLTLSMEPNNVQSGVEELQTLLNPGLSVVDDKGRRQPLLAETVPSIENGLWTVAADGRMETTWKLRPNTRWHDGTAFTADDLVFTASLGQDRDTPAFADEAYGAIDRVEALDPTTVRIGWRRPFIDADTMFTTRRGTPQPRHLLEPTYLGDKTSIKDLPFWTLDYVGTGPFRIREWTPGVHVMFEANDHFVLGRPNIDEIELDFMADANTLAANLLAGSIDFTLGSSALSSIDRAVELREQWKTGTIGIEFGQSTWVVIWPQFMDPSPRVVTDLRFRRALLQALDRQQMAESLQAGVVPVAHSFLSPNQPQYQEIEARLPRFAYDPRQAIQGIEELGYTRGADGLFRDPANQELAVELRNATVPIVQSTALAVADAWQQIGVSTSLLSIPPQRVSEWEWLATFPSFRLMTLRNDLRAVADLQSTRARVPANNFLVPGSGNWPRYANSSFDQYIDRYFSTIPLAERTTALGQIISHVSEQLVGLPLFYGGSPEAIGNRLAGTTANRASGSPLVWNVQVWTVKS